MTHITLRVPGPTARLFPDPDERARRRRITTSIKLDDQTTTRWHQSLAFVYAESKYLSFDPAAQDLTKPTTPPDTTFAFNDFANYFNNHQRRRGLRYQTELILPYNQLLSAGVDYEQERAVFDSGFTGRDRVPAANLFSLSKANRRSGGGGCQKNFDDQEIRVAVQEKDPRDGEAKRQLHCHTIIRIFWMALAPASGSSDNPGRSAGPYCHRSAPSPPKDG